MPDERKGWWDCATCSVSAVSLNSHSISSDMTELPHSSIRKSGERVVWTYCKPSMVEENQEAKLLWDFNLQTDRVINARRSDIVSMTIKKNEKLPGWYCCTLGWMGQEKRDWKMGKYLHVTEKVMGDESRNCTNCHWSMDDDDDDDETAMHADKIMGNAVATKINYTHLETSPEHLRLLAVT